MNAQERWRQAKLETILARHTASEQRALIDLDRAGFDFRSIEEAYAQLRRNRETARFTFRQYEIAMAAIEKQERETA